MWSQALGNVYNDKDKKHLLEECKRTLKPHGIFCFSGHDHLFVKKDYGRYTDGKKFYAQANTECYWELFTIEELKALSTSAGFNVIECASSIDLANDIEHQVLVGVVQK